jgi:hypothetical protein
VLGLFYCRRYIHSINKLDLIFKYKIGNEFDFAPL